MLREFPMVQGDRLPALVVTLRDANNAAIDLTNCTVTFWMQDADGNQIVAGGVVSIVGAPTEGKVSYAWGASDTAAVSKRASGGHRANFRVNNGSVVFTVPSADYIYVPVIAKLG